MDDYKCTSPFFLLTTAFAPLIDLVVDEAQFFLNSLRKNIQVFETQVVSEKPHQIGKPYETSYRTCNKKITVYAPPCFYKTPKDIKSNLKLYTLQMSPDFRHLPEVAWYLHFSNPNTHTNLETNATINILPSKGNPIYSDTDIQISDLCDFGIKGYSFHSDEIIHRKPTQNVFHFKLDEKILKHYDKNNKALHY